MFDWPDYLELTRRLATEAPDEAALRTAISRAYYAVFGAASGHLIEHGYRPGGADPHRWVWRTYQHGGNPDCARVGALGFLLRDRRNAVDYHRRVSFDLQTEVVTSLAFADRLLELLRDLDPMEGYGAGQPTTVRPS